MYLFYLDASGTPERTDTTSNHFVFLGVAFPESMWFQANNGLAQLKAEYGLPGIEFELHAKQFIGYIREQDEVPGFNDLPRLERRESVLKLRREKLLKPEDAKKKTSRRKKYAETEPFIHLNSQERNELFAAGLELLAGLDGVKLFAEIVSKNR